MKRIFCAVLAVVLVIGCLAGCQSPKEQFMTLENGEQAFGFTVEEFKTKFNSQVKDKTRQLGDWEQEESGGEKFYMYDYDGARIFAVSDSKTNYVKAVSMTV